MILAVDLETTGLNHEVDSITQIAAIALTDNLQPVGFFETFIKQEKDVKISKEVVDICGFDEVFLNTFGLLRYKAYEGFEKFIYRFFVNEKLMLLGHCVSFDAAFLKCFLDMHGSHIEISHRVLDLHTLARSLNGNGFFIENFSLKDIAKELGVKLPSAHDARCDIAITVECYKKLQDMLDKHYRAYLGQDDDSEFRI